MLIICYDIPEEKRRVNAAIDMKLYEDVMKLGYSISEAITVGLERLLEPKIEEIDTNTPSNESPCNQELVTSLQERIDSLEAQLRVKDTQLENKDSQLEKQAVHIQTLISQKAIEAPSEKKKWFDFWKFW